MDGAKGSRISSAVLGYGAAHDHVEEEMLHFVFWAAVISLIQIHYDTHLQNPEQLNEKEKNGYSI